MAFSIKTEKILSKENCKRIIMLGISLRDEMEAVEKGLIAEYDTTQTYTAGMSCFYDGYLWKCKYTTTGDFDESKWQLIGDDLELIEKSDIEAMLNLNDEQLKTLQSLILDSTIELSHVWSSSKTYEEIQNAIKKGEAFTLQELAKKTGASYKIVTNTTDVTSTEYLYLLANANNAYDIYALIDGTAQKIGDTTIDLSQFYTKTEIDNDFLKKADADSKFATITTVDGKVDKTSILTTFSSTPSDDKLLSEKAIDDTFVKKTDIDITTTIDENSTNTQVPSAKATYIGLNGKLDKVTELSEGTNTSYVSTTGIYKCNNWLNAPEGLPDNSGVLIVTNYMLDSSNAQYYFSQEFITPHKSDRYIRSYVKNSIGTWEKVCTTSVADVNKTNITLNSGFTGTVIYEVKNGVCYVNIINVSSITIGNGLVMSENILPKSSIGVITATIHHDFNDEKVGMVYIDPNSDNKLRLHCYRANTNGWCTLTYPIAE